MKEEHATESGNSRTDNIREHDARARSDPNAGQARTKCPVCSAGIELQERLLVGETVRCEACGTDLEVSDPQTRALIRLVRVEALDPER